MQVGQCHAAHDLRKLQHRALQNAEQRWKLPASCAGGGGGAPPPAVTPAEAQRLLAAVELRVRRAGHRAQCRTRFLRPFIGPWHSSFGLEHNPEYIWHFIPCLWHVLAFMFTQFARMSGTRAQSPTRISGNSFHVHRIVSWVGPKAAPVPIAVPASLPV